MKYNCVLFDLDDTLFDFQACAEKSFLNACAFFGLPHEKQNYSIYKVINQKYWDMYSEGKISKEDVLYLRFKEYFSTYDNEIDVREFGKRYESNLSNNFILSDGAEEVVDFCKKNSIKIYIVTNGVAKIQRKKLSKSNFAEKFDGLFISEEVGAVKPSKLYYDFVKSSIMNFDPEKTLICGDSLVSDIPLSVYDGIDTCWYNSEGKKNDKNLKITYEIKEIREIIEILK